ncbi:MAG TPA: L-threonylcarbamoyladenylate synthase [archaeon]|nr:L-threonylcarbamoyladenylate synthase [archaeon]
MKAEIISAKDKNCAKIAAQFMEKGEIIIYPTETSYGIGADIENKKALQKIYEIKKRPIEKQLIYLVSSAAMARKYAFITADHEKLIKAFMPNRQTHKRTDAKGVDSWASVLPLTLVAKGKKTEEFAFRISSNKLANEIVSLLGKPIASTSANFTGDPPLYKIRDVFRHFQGQVSLIIDAGSLRQRRPSTVVDLFNSINIRREGSITKQQITKSLHG